MILLSCSGDSGLWGLDLCSRVTGLSARWSSGRSLNSLRLKGSPVLSSWESTVFFVAMSGVDGETQSMVKILPRLLRSGSTDNVGVGLRSELSYSHFRRTHTSGVFTYLVWARCSHGICHSWCGLFAALLTHLAWARCSRSIHHAWRGLLAALLTRLAWAQCSCGIHHARCGLFAALLKRLAWAHFSRSIRHAQRGLFAALLTYLAWARCSRSIHHAWRGLFAAFLTHLAWARCSGEVWSQRRSQG